MAIMTPRMAPIAKYMYTEDTGPQVDEATSTHSSAIEWLQVDMEGKLHSVGAHLCDLNEKAS